MEAAVQLLKKGNSVGVDIPPELVQAGGEHVIAAVMTNCRKIWQTGEWPTPSTQSLVTCSSARTTEQSAPLVTQAKSCEDHTEQIEATSGEDHR